MVKVKVKVGHFNAFNAFNANGVFALVWMKTQIQSLSRGAAFGAVKIAVFPVTLNTKQHYKHCFISHYHIL